VRRGSFLRQRDQLIGFRKVSAIGFSRSTCLPASMLSFADRIVVGSGVVQIITAWIESISRSCRLIGGRRHRLRQARHFLKRS